MNCHTFRRRASLLMDDRLGESESRHLKEHLAHCSACRNLYEKDLAINANLRKRAEIVPPQELVERVEQAVLGDRRRGPAFPLPVWARAFVATTAVLVSVAVGTFAGTRLIDVWERDGGDEIEFLNLAQDSLSLEDFIVQVGRKESM